MFNSLFSGADSATLLDFLICALVSIVCGFIIALVHKKTSSYSKNFLITLSTLPFLVSIVIFIVNGNLGTSVAIMGAFSLVRFRSIQGTSKEILSVFFSMTVGLACGIGNIYISLIVTLIGCVTIYLFSKANIFNKTNNSKILKILVPENLDYTNMFNEEFNKYTKSNILENVKTTNMGSLFELTYKINLLDNINEKDFIDDLRVKNGNLKIILTHEINENEL